VVKRTDARVFLFGHRLRLLHPSEKFVWHAFTTKYVFLSFLVTFVVE